jgi:hypothetical protein
MPINAQAMLRVLTHDLAILRRYAPCTDRAKNRPNSPTRFGEEAFIITRIESIARSAARRPRSAPAHPQQFRPRLTTTRGDHIAAVCFRLRSPPDLYFATHTVASRRSNRYDVRAPLTVAPKLRFRPPKRIS